jgi:hypothetical protein
MNIKSLTLKNKLTTETTGEQYYDLTAPTFTYDTDYGLRALHYVLADQEGRIDKISELYFGTSEFIDAICVVNNIFNPFSVKEGDILIIPNLNKPDIFYKKPEVASRPNAIQATFTDTAGQSQKDQNRIQRIVKKAQEKKSGVSNPLPPNMLQPGQTSKVFENGNIKLGTNLQQKSTFKNTE